MILNENAYFMLCDAFVDLEHIKERLAMLGMDEETQKIFEIQEKIVKKQDEFYIED